MDTREVGSLHGKRLLKELKDITLNPPPNITAKTKNGNLSTWIATLEGPRGTPYAGGKFKLTLQFPKDYPFSPPKVKFDTKIYHANVSVGGEICLDILNDKWSPALSVSKMLLSISSLMADCNPYSSLNHEAAYQYRYMRKEHDRIARHYTVKYATK